MAINQLEKLTRKIQTENLKNVGYVGKDDVNIADYNILVNKINELVLAPSGASSLQETLDIGSVASIPTPLTIGTTSTVAIKYDDGAGTISQLSATSVSVGVSVSKSGGIIGLVINNTIGGFILDTILSQGWKYTADYSVNGIAVFGDRWIPDYGAVKAYADSVGGGGSLWTAGLNGGVVLDPGSGSLAQGVSAVAEGTNTTASLEGCHAEGLNTTASGTGSHAQGINTTASGSSSHAEGNQSDATGISAHAEGGETDATGDYSHSEGFLTRASAYGAHAQGSYTQASGINSHAGGGGSTEFLHKVIASGLTSFNHSSYTKGNTSIAAAANSAILGGLDHDIAAGGLRSAIIGGSNHSIGAFADSVILGGSGFTALAESTVYVPNLEVWSLTANIIMRSPNGTRYKAIIDDAGAWSIVLA